MTRAGPPHPIERRGLKTGSPRWWRALRAWLPCLAMMGTLTIARSQPTNPAAATPSDPAKLTVRGFGLLGNRQLTKIIRLARAEPVRPEFFDADFAEDAVLILLARLAEAGHLEPRVVAQLDPERRPRDRAHLERQLRHHPPPPFADQAPRLPRVPRRSVFL